MDKDIWGLKTLGKLVIGTAFIVLLSYAVSVYNQSLPKNNKGAASTSHPAATEQTDRRLQTQKPSVDDSTEAAAPDSSSSEMSMEQMMGSAVTYTFPSPGYP